MCCCLALANRWFGSWAMVDGNMEKGAARDRWWKEDSGDNLGREKENTPWGLTYALLSYDDPDQRGGNY